MHEETKRGCGWGGVGEENKWVSYGDISRVHQVIIAFCECGPGLTAIAAHPPTSSKNQVYDVNV